MNLWSYKKAVCLVIAGVILANYNAFNQTQAINTLLITGGTSAGVMNANAALEIQTPNKGLLLPRVSLSSTNNPSPLTTFNATIGMVVYNTGVAASGISSGYYYSTGYRWVRLAPDTSTWNITGNNGTTPGTNFIGTNDAADFVTKTNGTEAMRITNGQQILMGTSNVPAGGSSAKLIIDNGANNGAIQIKDGSEGIGKVLTSDATGLATWTTLTYGYRLISLDINSNSGSQTLTATDPDNQQLISGSELTVTIPAFANNNNKVIVRWDVWGDVDNSGNITNGSGSLRFGATYNSPSYSGQTRTITMASWALVNNYISRFSTPGCYIFSDLPEGIYTFRLSVNRENESVEPSSINIWNVYGKGEVYFK